MHRAVDLETLPPLPPAFHWSTVPDPYNGRPYVFVGHALSGPWVAAVEPAKAGGWRACLGRYRPQSTDRGFAELAAAIAYVARWLALHGEAIDVQYRAIVASDAGRAAARLTREEKREIHERRS